MTHVSSGDGLLTWGRTLVQHNRTHNPAPTSAHSSQQPQPQQRTSSAASATPSHPSGRQSPASSRGTTPRPKDEGGIAPSQQGAGAVPSSNASNSSRISAPRFPDTAVEAEHPHWRKAEQLRQSPVSFAGSTTSSAGGASKGRGGGSGSLPPTGKQQQPQGLGASTTSSRGGRGSPPPNPTPSAGVPVLAPVPAAAAAAPVVGAASNVATPTPVVPTSESPLDRSFSNQPKKPPSEAGVAAPSSTRSTPVQEPLSSRTSGVPPLGGGGVPALLAASSAASVQERKARTEKEKQILIETIQQEQSHLEELQHMMQRNEGEFHKRQEELMGMLQTIEAQVHQQQLLQQQQGTHTQQPHQSERSSVSTTAPQQASTGTVDPEAEKHIRSLEEELWNVELDLEKCDREEAVCGAAVVQLADCIKLSENRLEKASDRLLDVARLVREVGSLASEVRAVAVKTPSLPKIVFDNNATAGTGGGTDTSAGNVSIHTSSMGWNMQGRLPAELVVMPSESEFLALEPHDLLNAISLSLSSTLKSIGPVLDDAQQIRLDKLDGLQQAVVQGQALLDKQSLTIDDAHQALSGLQQDIDQRKELIQEERFNIGRLEEQRTSTGSRRTELSSVTAELNTKLQALKSTEQCAQSEASRLEHEAAQANREREQALRNTEDTVERRTAVEEATRTTRADSEQIDAEKFKQRKLFRTVSSEEEELNRTVKDLRDQVAHLESDVSKVDAHRVNIQAELDEKSSSLRKIKRETEEAEAESRELDRQHARAIREEESLSSETNTFMEQQIRPTKEELEKEIDELERQKRREKDLAEDLELCHLVLTAQPETPGQPSFEPPPPLPSASTRSLPSSTPPNQAPLDSQSVHNASRDALVLSPEAAEPASKSAAAPMQHEGLPPVRSLHQTPEAAPLSQGVLPLQHAQPVAASTVPGMAPPQAGTVPGMVPPAAGIGSSMAPGMAPAGNGMYMYGNRPVAQLPPENVLYVQPAPTHYPPTVELLPAASASRERSSTEGDANSRPSVRRKRWGPGGGPSMSQDREPSEGGTSASSRLSNFYRGYPSADGGTGMAPRNSYGSEGFGASPNYSQPPRNAPEASYLDRPSRAAGPQVEQQSARSGGVPLQSSEGYSGSTPTDPEQYSSEYRGSVDGEERQHHQQQYQEEVSARSQPSISDGGGGGGERAPLLGSMQPRHQRPSPPKNIPQQHEPVPAAAPAGGMHVELSPRGGHRPPTGAQDPAAAAGTAGTTRMPNVDDMRARIDRYMTD